MASIWHLMRYGVLQMNLSLLLCFLPLGKGTLENSVSGLVAPFAGCQDNWFEVDVYIYYDSIIQRTAISYPLAANIEPYDNNSIILKFCMWNGTENTIPYEPAPYEEFTTETYDDLDLGETLFDFGDRTAGYLESWPPGKYCIYNVGKLEVHNSSSFNWDYGKCPEGFTPGWSTYPFVVQPLDTGETMYSPYGPYIRHRNHTKIEFCCSNSTSSKPISLPFVKPFYLLPIDGTNCQPVRGTDVRLDWIQWPHLQYDGGSHPFHEESSFKNGTVFYMCYYIPNMNKLIISLTYIITLGSVALSLTFFFMMGWCHRKSLEWNHNRMLSLQYSGYNKDDSA